MAYVAISTRLKSDIRHKINQMASKELNAVKEPPAPDITPEMIEKKIWGEHYHLKGVIPESWLQKADGSGVHLYGTVEGTNVWGSYTYLPRGSLVLPPRFRSSVTFSVEEMPSLTFWHEFQKQRKEVQERWQNIGIAIDSYLESCKSLNDALKHMEELQYYVPEQYLRKVNEKVERKKSDGSGAKDTAAGIDKDALVAGVIAARLAGS